MKILKAKWIFLCDDDFNILKDKSVAFDNKILAIDDDKILKKLYPNAVFKDLGDSILSPSFVNTHVHLEFSSNKHELRYGDFMIWLNSIIKNSNILLKKNNFQKKALNTMIKSGIGAIGAISSYGLDLDNLANSPIKVVYFNEILGSNPNGANDYWINFKKRFYSSLERENDLFKASLALHAPYSISQELAKKAINFAQKNDLIISTHFLESKDEFLWLKNANGRFKDYLKKFINKPMPAFNLNSFFDLFKDNHTLFTHCVYFKKAFSEFKILKDYHHITHCATSNRLLGQTSFDLKNALKDKINLNIGTDGLSSNLSLNFFDEFRNIIFTHKNINLGNLCKNIFLASTKGGAKALKLNSGEIKVGKMADFAVFNSLKNIIVKDLSKKNREDFLIQFMLHTKFAKEIYINGNNILI